MVHKSLLTFAVLASATFAFANVEIPIEGHVFGPINGQGTWQGGGEVSSIHSPRLGSTQSVQFSHNGIHTRGTVTFGSLIQPVKLDQNGYYIWNLDFMGTGTQSLIDGDFLWQRVQLMNATAPFRQVAAAGVASMSRGMPYIGMFPLTVTYNPDNATVGLSAFPLKINDGEWYTITRFLDMKRKRMQGIILRNVSANDLGAWINVSTDFLGYFDGVGNSAGPKNDVIEQIRFGHDAYSNLQKYYYDNIQFLKAKRISGTFNFDPPGAPVQFKGSPESVQCTLWAFPASGGDAVKMPFNPAIDIVDNEIEFATGLLPGTYDTYIEANGYLSKRLGRLNITNTDGELEVGNFELAAGDIDGDDAITTDDYLILNRTFGLKPGNPLYDPRADLDGDGFVTTDDYLIFNFNFDQIGALREDGRLD